MSVKNIAQAKSTSVSKERAGLRAQTPEPVSIRVSPNNYFAVLFFLTFYSGLLIYLQLDRVGTALFALAWIFLPFLALTDRIAFDGKRLIRTGFVPRAWFWLNKTRNYLKLSDVEQVETQALRALKRGGNVFYRYRTSLQGRETRFVFASGSEDYRRMIEAVLPHLPEDILDNRSLELRDYLSEPKETLMKAEFAHIPSAEVLETSLGKRADLKRQSNDSNDEDIEKADYLRVLGNELRLSGYLLQALEAFRRALVLNPKDGWLIYEFARCLHSFASSERDRKLETKAFAALRLAERRADGDGELLTRLGETYFQYGDIRRARQAFQKTLSKAEESFRSVRGLAEIALREGKLAHVIHHFASAQRLAQTASLRRWTRNETEYFTRLNSDDDYLEMEVSRINMLESLERAIRSSLRIALSSIPLILFGIVLEDSLIANIGWAVSSIALLVWLGLIVAQKMFSARIPPELLEEDE